MRLTDKDKALIANRYHKTTAKALAATIGCDVHTVKFWADRLGVVRQESVLDADGGQFLREHILTMPKKDIAKHYGCTVVTVTRYIRKHGIADVLPARLVIDGVSYKQAMPNVHISREGRVLHNGKPIKTNRRRHTNGRKQSAYVCITEHGRTQYYLLSRLVAKAWLCGYKEECYILYKDGDIHNVAADNLVLASQKQYVAFMQRNSGNKGADLGQRKDKLSRVIEEANITLHYLKTADITPLNRHVEKYLYPMLTAWCRDKLHLGVDTVMTIVPECIARLYEIVMNGACIYNYERFCKKMLMNYKTKGKFGNMASVPKPIQIIVEQLNTDCLWQKFKVTNFKH